MDRAAVLVLVGIFVAYPTIVRYLFLLLRCNDLSDDHRLHQVGPLSTL